ncbi:MAG: diaminopimelate epimerase [Gammaproteobacteria bacterium]|nr:MAG: diaminopimelate epimerase [Gammaproteobacteria bacterium]
MKLKFTKMHGLGNDFVVIDAINQKVSLNETQIRLMADRHFGIGCDQLLLVEAAQSVEADFRYRIFNADGGEVSQCGNGARCFARFVREKGLSDQKDIPVETGAGLLILHHEENGDITVNMAVPRHLPGEIPLCSEQEKPLYEVAIDGRHYQFGAVSLGNPHAVLQVEDIAKAPVETLGAQLECHPMFPQRANIGFMKVISEHHIELRVYERGAAETMACGSGACAAAVIGIERGLLNSPVKVDLPGGQLMISWQGRGQPLFMSGPATIIFDGIIEI